MNASRCRHKGCTRPIFEEGRCVDHAPLLAPNILATQLGEARQRIRNLEAELRIAETEAATHGIHLTWRTDELLLDVVKLLNAGHEASGALVTAAADTGRISGSKSQPTPGGSTKLARRRVREFRHAIAEACTTFETVMENEWHRPRVDDGIPTVRCHNRACRARDVSVKAWREIRGGRRIYAEHCFSCGLELSGREGSTDGEGQNEPEG